MGPLDKKSNTEWGHAFIHRPVVEKEQLFSFYVLRHE